MTYDIEVTWKEGATEDEVKEVTKGLEENVLPAGVQAVKITRTESYSATPVNP